MRIRPRMLAAVVPLGAALLASACSSAVATGTSAGAGGKIVAIGAENQYASVIQQVGGKYAQVSAIMSNPATDPHTYDASTGVAQMISSAQLIVQNGVGYDSFMSQLESASPNKARKVIVVQKLLNLPLATPNPHLWYAPSTMPAVAAQVEKDLISLDPRHRGYFAQRLSAFKSSLAPLDIAIAAFKARFAGRTVATTQPVADYLLIALGLDNLTPFRFQADIMNGVDPSPEDIAYQEGLFTHHRVKLFCYNAQVSSSVTVSLRALAEKSHVPEVAVYETMPTPGYDFQSWMLAEVNAMTRALTVRASTKTLP